MGAVLQDMPLNAYDSASLTTWEDKFIGRFGTHVSVAAQHGALIQSLASIDTSCHLTSDCLQQQVCLDFSYQSYADAHMCENSSECPMNKGCSSLYESTCVVSGGDPAAAANNLCSNTTTAADMNHFLASGDMTSPSSVFGWTFKSISEVMDHMGMAHESQTLEKAVEFHGCKPPSYTWGKDSQGGYSCSCTLKCNNGGVLDKESCLCKCPGDEYHGWNGPTCDETYGACQMGLNSGNPASARKCAIDGTCKSNYWGATCKDTDVCCLTDFHGTCCPFGSKCKCSTGDCSCLDQLDNPLNATSGNLRPTTSAIVI